MFDPATPSPTRWPALTVWLAVAVLALVCVTAARGQDLTPQAPTITTPTAAAPR